MKIKEIYVGSWYPRTLFHLNEMYDFLSSGESHLNLDKTKLIKLKDELNPQNVELKQSKGKSYLKAQFNKYEFESFESGLSLFFCKNIDCDFKKIEAETQKMSEFAFKKVFSSFNFIYSLGAPIPKVFSALKSVMPFVFITEDFSKDDVVKFLKARGEVITKEFVNEKAEIYYGTQTIIIDGETEFAKRVIKECIYYLHDAEVQFKKILDLHRYIWDEVSKIKSSKSIKYKDLAATRDLLTEIESDVIFFDSRIKQLEIVLEKQKKKVSNFANTEDDYIWEVFEDGFDSLEGSGVYIYNLWEMTKNYLSGATRTLNMVYQESSNKQINILQFVFIISAIATLISLGEIVASDIIGTINLETGLIVATQHSFSWSDLLKFSLISIISGGLIYYLWDKLYKHIAGSKISDPEMIAKSKFNKIKKMFN